MLEENNFEDRSSCNDPGENSEDIFDHKTTRFIIQFLIYLNKVKKNGLSGTYTSTEGKGSQKVRGEIKELFFVGRTGYKI